MRECQEKTTAFLSKGKVIMPNNLNASSDGYRVTAAQFAVKAIANTPRSPRFCWFQTLRLQLPAGVTNRSIPISDVDAVIAKRYGGILLQGRICLVLDFLK